MAQATKKVEKLTLPELKELATGEGIAFEENVTRKVLIEALAAKEITEVELEDDEDAEDSDDEADEDAGASAVYYLFKNPTYVDDSRKESNKLVPAGFYRREKRLARFEGLRANPDVVIYDGRPQDYEIAKIAEMRGVKVPVGKDADFDALLETLVNKWPF